MDEIRCERAFMLFALLSCSSGSSTSGSASAKLFRVLLGRPGTLAAVGRACLSMPAVMHTRWVEYCGVFACTQESQLSHPFFSLAALLQEC